jgi:hypothetical protein
VPTPILAHEVAWKTARIAHCDISPGNIQIHQQRGILADWECAVSVDKLDTTRALNSVGYFPFQLLEADVAAIGNLRNHATTSCVIHTNNRHATGPKGSIQNSVGRNVLCVLLFPLYGVG